MNMQEILKLLQVGNEIYSYYFYSNNSNRYFITKDFKPNNSLEINVELFKKIKNKLTLTNQNNESYFHLTHNENNSNKVCKLKVYKHSEFKSTSTELFNDYIDASEASKNPIDLSLRKIIINHKYDFHGLLEKSNTIEEYISFVRKSDITNSGLIDSISWELMNGSSLFKRLLQDAYNGELF